jgi:hypothetical protein
MKKLKMISTAVLAAIVMSTSANAQSTTKTNHNEGVFTVKYAGHEGDYLCFVVEVNAPFDKIATLKVTDKAEGELYAQNWKTTCRVQKFKIERKEEGQELNFKFVVGDKTFTKTFATTVSVVENVLVDENTAK